MTDTRPLVAYTVTLIANGHAHRIRTVARDDEHLHGRIREDALRRAVAHYQPADTDVDQLTVDWGNVDTWELRDLTRGRAWGRSE